jgi:hypothetical protein
MQKALLLRYNRNSSFKISIMSRRFLSVYIFSITGLHYMKNLNFIIYILFMKKAKVRNISFLSFLSNS